MTIARRGPIVGPAGAHVGQSGPLPLASWAWHLRRNQKAAATKKKHSGGLEATLERMSGMANSTPCMSERGDADARAGADIAATFGGDTSQYEVMDDGSEGKVKMNCQPIHNGLV